MAEDLAGVGSEQGEGTLREAAARCPQSRIHGQGGRLAGVGHVHQTGTYGKNPGRKRDVSFSLAVKMLVLSGGALMLFKTMQMRLT